jgi:predicted nucleotidyltransferase
MQKHKTIMLDLESYNKLLSAKDAASRKSGRNLSFNAFILELVSRKLDFLDIDDSLRRYLIRLAARLASISHIDGVLLFGSVAKGSYKENSDIDILILTKDGGGYHEVMKVINSLRVEADGLSDKGLPSLVCPILIGMQDTKRFRPLYLDLADYGIILYERESALTDFINSVSRTKHERTFENGVEVLTWQ